jgi:hypothetical protein
MNDSSPRFSDPRWDLAIGGAALVALPLCVFSPVLMLLATAATYSALVVRLARADRFRGQPKDHALRVFASHSRVSAAVLS